MAVLSGTHTTSRSFFYGDSGYGGELGGRGYSSSVAYLELNTTNTIPNTKK